MTNRKKSLITIIIPIYKAQKYIKHCVKSIRVQSYDNFELLLIDDGSPDDCPEICDKLATEDRRIRVIHKENGGVSSARNIGIDEAKGDFICFCDADDWMDENAIWSLYKAMTSEVDFTYGKVTSVFGTQKTVNGPSESSKYSITDEDFNCLAFEDLLSVIGPWGKLYRTSIIRNNHILFDEKIAYGEDRIFLWKYLKNCNKITAINENVYFYSQLNAGSACNLYYRELPEWCCYAIDEFKSLFDNCEKEKRFNQLIGKRAIGLMEYCVHQDLENLEVEEIVNSLPKIAKLFSKYLPYFENCLYEESYYEQRREKALIYISGKYDIYQIEKNKECKLKIFVRRVIRKMQAYRIYSR